MVDVCNIMRIVKWSVPRAISMCQLVRVTIRDNDNATSGKLGAAWLSTLVGRF